MTRTPRYRKRKANGLCVTCGIKLEITEDRVSCAPCRKWFSDYQKTRVKAKICRRCGGQNTSKHWLCFDCLKADQERTREMREALKELGLCVLCRKPAAPGVTRCEVCRVKDLRRGKVTYTTRKAAGLCLHCAAGAVVGKTRCLACAERDRANGKARRAKR